MSIEISVIIPVYNVESYIEDTLVSICNQSFRNFEIIIVDDGSTDNSIGISEAVLQKTDVPWQIIRQANKGQAAARNAGISHAHGNWIICPDSDDAVNEDFLLRLYNAANRFDTYLAFCEFQMVSEKNKLMSPDRDEGDHLLTQKEVLDGFLKRKIRIISPGILVKKSFLEKSGVIYNEKYRFTEDLIFVWELIYEAGKVAYVKAPLYNYLRRPNSIMTSSKAEAIISGCNGIEALSVRLYDKYALYRNITKKIFPRWLLGALRSAARILDYRSFAQLCRKVKYRRIIPDMLAFPDIRAKALALALLFGCRTFFFFVKFLDRQEV